jgi:putative CRISPR-associated protein (TIGR02619 family)
MKKVITTVGISLLENLKINIPKSLKKRTFSQCGEYDENINEVKENITQKISTVSVESLCAEVQTLLAIKKNHPQIETELICTDTILSVICADAIKPILENNGINVNFDRNLNRNIISDLVVEGTDAFKKFADTGFSNLIDQIKNIEKTSSQDNRPILNISGGYKALIPVMTIMGQLYNMEVNYIYEDSEELITIGRLPIQFDTGIAELYLFYLDNTFLANKTLVSQHRVLVEKLCAWKLVEKKSDNYHVSILGTLFNKFVGKNISGGKSILGSIMELKLFEYFFDNGFCLLKQGEKFDLSGFKIKKRGKKIGKKNLDIDLYYESDMPNEVMFGEVKSMKEAATEDEDNFKKIVGDVKKRFEAAKNENLTLKHYVLFIYKCDFQELRYADNLIQDMLKSANDLKIGFSVFWIDIPVTDDCFNYQSFVKESIAPQPYLLT